MLNQDLLSNKIIGIFAKNTMEIWKDVVEYEGLYQVSSEGRVKSLERKVDNGYFIRTFQERILKPVKTKKGYQQVVLCKEGKMKHMYVHRIVANAFLPNPENYNEVNHKDENKENNSVENLEWCDTSYNINYGTRNERMVEKLSKTVLQLTLDSELIREWPSIMEAGRNGFHQGAVCNCCNGKLNRYKGFIWRYKEDTSS